MRFHSQNLNEKRGDRMGSMLRYGRCWLQLWDRACLRFEWNFRIAGPRLELDMASGQDGDVLGIGIGIFFLSMWLTFEYWKWAQWLGNKIKRADQRYGNGRVMGFYWFEGSLWFSLWRDDMEWRREDRWWARLIVITPADILLGRTKGSHRELSTHRVEIPMPEACYPATVSIQEWEWRRARWPFPKRIIRSEITPDTPIPFPGKGENAWDCGEDATHSMLCQAETPLEAVSAMVNSVLNDRYRHGGKMWRPASAVESK